MKRSTERGEVTDNKLFENIVLDDEFYPLVISMAMYKFFMSQGKPGMEAMLVWLHLQFTARLQKTNTVKATPEYLRRGLKMGAHKIESAKAFLKRKGLIEYVTRRDDQGHAAAWYVKLKVIHKQETLDRLLRVKNDESNSTDSGGVGEGSSPTPPKSTAVETNSSGSGRQMLKGKKTNALKKKKKEGAPPTGYPQEGDEEGLFQWLMGIRKRYYPGPLDLQKMLKKPKTREELKKWVDEIGAQGFAAAYDHYLRHDSNMRDLDLYKRFHPFALFLNGAQPELHCEEAQAEQKAARRCHRCGLKLAADGYCHECGWTAGRCPLCLGDLGQDRSSCSECEWTDAWTLADVREREQVPA